VIVISVEPIDFVVDFASAPIRPLVLELVLLPALFVVSVRLSVSSDPLRLSPTASSSNCAAVLLPPMSAKKCIREIVVN
jgi:hypothetical protein